MASLYDILMNGRHSPGMNWMQTQLLRHSLSLQLKDQLGNRTPPVTPSASGFLATVCQVIKTDAASGVGHRSIEHCYIIGLLIQPGG